MLDRRIQLKVKVKTFAAEARIIRKEELKATGRQRISLHLHRVGIVRSGARYAQIAYGFIRGREYLQIERNAKTPPDRVRLRKEVERFGVCRSWGLEGEGLKGYQERKDRQDARLEAWLETITTKELVC